jgi:hypothetical protein
MAMIEPTSQVAGQERVEYNNAVNRESRSVEREQKVNELRGSAQQEANRPEEILLDQTMQLSVSGNNLQTAEKTARKQIEQGFLDVRV